MPAPMVWQMMLAVSPTGPTARSSPSSRRLWLTRLPLPRCWIGFCRRPPSSIRRGECRGAPGAPPLPVARAGAMLAAGGYLGGDMKSVRLACWLTVLLLGGCATYQTPGAGVNLGDLSRADADIGEVM